MVLARSCSLTAAAGLLAPVLGQSFNSMRERLRDTYLEAEAKAGEKHAWKPEWLALLKQFRGLLPAGWTVIVLADRVLYAKWLFDTAIPVHPVTAKNKITILTIQLITNIMPLWKKCLANIIWYNFL